MKLSDYAKKVGVSYRTAYRWFKADKIRGYQMDTGTIVITEEDEQRLQQKIAVYTRVSSAENRPNLSTQAERLIAYCAAKGWQIHTVVKEVGSGVNDNRKKFLKLLADPTITIIVVEHKDRATCFGFRYLETLLELQGRRIEVRMFSDRLEIISPGGLPGYITLDNIVDEHFSRNPRVVSGIFQWGYIEELGLGVDLMIDEMTSAGHPPPTFRAEPYLFGVTFHNKQDRPPIARWQRVMNERQTKALEYLHRQGRITSREYRALCPDVSAETLRLDLVDLVDKGILLKIGDKKGTYYILK